MKLGLGTVQFGTNYGVSNIHGKVSGDEVNKILTLAERSGIEVLDTAPGYGDSESVLGANGVSARGFRLVTKTPGFRNTGAKDIEDCVRESFQRSLAQLGSAKIYGILVHHAYDLCGPAGAKILHALTVLKQSGLVDKIGVSVYDASQIDAVLVKFVPDIIQLPINVIDQRLIANGYLRILKELGIEIHARSLFLQGILLMETEQLPNYFRQVTPHLTEYAQFVQERQLTRLEAALGFIQQQKEVDVAIVGVTSRNELTEIISAWNSRKAKTLNMSRFGLYDEAIVNPSKWRISS